MRKSRYRGDKLRGDDKSHLCTTLGPKADSRTRMSLWQSPEFYMTLPLEEVLKRLNRIHAAIGKTLVSDPAKLRPRIDITPGVFTMDACGDMTQDEIENYAWSAVHTISTLLDHLLEWADGNEPLCQRIWAKHKGSRALTVLRALDNKDKHPRARGKNEDLRLVKIGRVMHFASSKESGPAHMRVSLRDGSITPFGNVSQRIVGTVVNSGTGENVGELDELLSEAVAEWERFMRELGLLS